jgi:hypothetical protein
MNNFDKNWRSAKKSIFHLQGRAEYKVTGEPETIEKWKQGELNLDRDKVWQKWQALLKSAKTKGICVQRVRVAPKPFSEYVRFEIDLWKKYSSKLGEKLHFLGKDEYQGIIATLGFNPKDFWLFDDKILLIFNYDKTGKFVGEIMISDGEIIRRYSDLKTKLIKESNQAKSLEFDKETATTKISA